MFLECLNEMEASEFKHRFGLTLLTYSQKHSLINKKYKSQLTLFTKNEMKEFGANIKHTKKVAKLILAQEFCDIELF